MRLRDLLYIPPLPKEVHHDSEPGEPCPACEYAKRRRQTLAGVIGGILITIGHALGGDR